MSNVHRHVTVRLTKEQIDALHSISKSHTSPAHIYNVGDSHFVEVEFEFPYRYEIAPDGLHGRVKVY